MIIQAVSSTQLDKAILFKLCMFGNKKYKKKSSQKTKLNDFRLISYFLD